MSQAASQPAADISSCAVCGHPLRPDAQADCYSCGQYFHLGLTANSDVEDCGQVWLDDEVLALQFACNRCLEAQTDAAPGGDAEDEAAREAPPRVARAEPGLSARDLARRRRGR